jgi:hypothetical protein
MDAPLPPATSPSAKAPNARQLAVRRKRQVVGGSLVAFGATVALVMTNPITSEASGPAQASLPTPGSGSQLLPQQPANPRPGGGTGTSGGTSTGPAQPAPSFFGPAPTQAPGGTAPQIRSGGGRRGSVGSGGS